MSEYNEIGSEYKEQMTKVYDTTTLQLMSVMAFAEALGYEWKEDKQGVFHFVDGSLKGARDGMAFSFMVYLHNCTDWVEDSRVSKAEKKKLVNKASLVRTKKGVKANSMIISSNKLNKDI